MSITGPIPQHIAEKIDEAKVRAMRDEVFGVPPSDGNWRACREYWMRADSVEWLKSKTHTGGKP